MITLVYRISDSGFNKTKPSYINNENCLRNLVSVFPISEHEWYVLADGVSDETKNMMNKYVPEHCIEHISFKRGPGYPFLYSLNKILKEGKNDDIIYFVENDYVHKKESDKVLKEGIELGANYVTLYDHPDKYINADKGGNPFIEGGGEITQVFLSNSCHWKLTNSTTGTFASTIKILREDYNIIAKWANNDYWNDFHMFLELREKGRTLLSPLPGYSTHGETAWLTPLINWEEEILKSHPNYNMT